MKTKSWDYGKLHSVLEAHKYGIGFRIYYLDAYRKPPPSTYHLLFFLRIGIGRIADTSYKHFLFAFDMLHFNYREMEKVRIRFHSPLEKKQFFNRQHRNKSPRTSIIASTLKM